MQPKSLDNIIKYNPARMYFGNWSENVLNSTHDEAVKTKKPQKLYVGDLTNDIICNALWYEMSYNPERFSKTSPFIVKNQNNLVYFDTTYKTKMSHKTKDFLPDEIVNLTWNINVFLGNLKTVNLYNTFVTTGKLPNFFTIAAAKTITNGILCLDTDHRILHSLNEAIHAIAEQNYLDLNDPMYRDKIIQTVQQRHPTGKRSDISYMMVDAEVEAKNKSEQEAQQIIQTALPFGNIQSEALAAIRKKIVQKEDEIAVLEQQIKEMEELNYADLASLYTKKSHLELQYAQLCSQEARLLNKIKLLEQKQNSGH